MITHHKKLPFQYKDKSFSISVKHSSRKTVGISVHPDKKIEITAPVGTSFALIQRVIERKSKWISSQLNQLEKYQVMEQIREYISGQTLKLLGRDYMIRLIQIEDFEEERIKKEKRLLKVYVHDRNQSERINLLIEDWLRNEAMIYLAQKFEECYDRVKKYNISKPLYYLRYMNRRWGSCTSKGTVLLNPDIIQLPSHCIEYIIMHELCHLKYRNHSKEFYHFFDTVMPNWKDCSQALDSFLQA